MAGDDHVLHSTKDGFMRRSILSLAMLATLSTGACHGGDTPTELEATAAAGREAAEVDPRDQYALAQAITQARASTEQLDSALARTRSAWIGRRYRWELAFMPALCGKTGPCVMMPFDHQRDPEHPIRQGWLPRLELADAERQALVEACGAHSRCVVDVSGHLGQLELSTEQPTSMTLSKVEIHGVREARSGESWVLGTRRPPLVSRRSTAPHAG
jgi:hypothetical protein